MKKIKVYLSIIIVAMIVAITTGVYAYDGAIIFNDKIYMPDNIVNGTADVEVTRDVTNYTMYYEFVEIDNSTYKQIVKLKDELEVAQYYNIWESLDGLDNTETENYKKYVEVYNAYKTKYGTEVDDYTEEHIDEVESQIVALWATYTDNWTTASGNTVSIDLSTFTGTKDYVLWVKVKDSITDYYFADVYELTGTKKEETPPKPDKPDDTPTNTDKPDDTPTNTDKPNENNTPTNTDKPNENNAPTNTDKPKENNAPTNTNKQNVVSTPKNQNNTDVVTGKTLPKTGISSVFAILIVMSAIATGISYTKYKKIK